MHVPDGHGCGQLTVGNATPGGPECYEIRLREHASRQYCSDANSVLQNMHLKVGSKEGGRSKGEAGKLGTKAVEVSKRDNDAVN